MPPAKHGMMTSDVHMFLWLLSTFTSGTPKNSAHMQLMSNFKLVQHCYEEAVTVNHLDSANSDSHSPCLEHGLNGPMKRLNFAGCIAHSPSLGYVSHRRRDLSSRPAYLCSVIMCANRRTASVTCCVLCPPLFKCAHDGHSLPHRYRIPSQT